MKEKIRKKLNLILSMIIIVVLSPMMITIVYQRMELEAVLYGIVPDGAMENTDGNNVAGSEAEAEKKVVGIVAKEISVNSSPHAILAQSVIARTGYYDAVKTGMPEPEGFTVEEMQALWGESFEEIYHSMQQYAEQTKGEVLMYNGNYIYAAYHAVSAGKTRVMEEFYPDTDMPYLIECICTEDAAADGYLSVLYWGKEEFLQQCRKFFPDASLESLGEIVVQKRDAAGYVLEIAVGKEIYTGEEFRHRWGLSSACFSVAEDGDKVRIVTKGLGHGFGLSQYSANQMAKEGKDYREILSFFYPGANIEKK